MESRYLQTTIGKFHGFIVGGSLFIMCLGYAYEYAEGKVATFWGLGVSIVGFLSLLKAKLSVIKKGTRVSFGCDLMDQKNTWFYFVGWVLMISGYFLSFE